MVYVACWFFFLSFFKNYVSNLCCLLRRINLILLDEPVLLQVVLLGLLILDQSAGSHSLHWYAGWNLIFKLYFILHLSKSWLFWKNYSSKKLRVQATNYYPQLIWHNNYETSLENKLGSLQHIHTSTVQIPYKDAPDATGIDPFSCE